MDTQTASEWVDAAPWRTRDTTIVHIQPSGQMQQATTLAVKRTILTEAEPGETLLALWHGQWRTEARMVTQTQARAILERIA